MSDDIGIVLKCLESWQMQTPNAQRANAQEARAALARIEARQREQRRELGDALYEMRERAEAAEARAEELQRKLNAHVAANRDIVRECDAKIAAFSESMQASQDQVEELQRALQTELRAVNTLRGCVEDAERERDELATVLQRKIVGVAPVDLDLLSRVGVLQTALREIKSELGVPDENYPAPVANAVDIADRALDSLLARLEQTERSILICPFCCQGYVPEEKNRHKDRCAGCLIAEQTERERDDWKADSDRRAGEDTALMRRIGVLEAALREYEEFLDAYDDVEQGVADFDLHTEAVMRLRAAHTAVIARRALDGEERPDFDQHYGATR